ncbi:MAG: IS66 family insertion sequence element accessory protein TnpA, partial [Syntrophobacteraceae bacterium]
MSSNVSRSGKQQLWEKHIAQWNASGLSQAEYCRSNKIGLK